VLEAASRREFASVYFARSLLLTTTCDRRPGSASAHKGSGGSVTESARCWAQSLSTAWSVGLTSRSTSLERDLATAQPRHTQEILEQAADEVTRASRRLCVCSHRNLPILSLWQGFATERSLQEIRHGCRPCLGPDGRPSRRRSSRATGGLERRNQAQLREESRPSGPSTGRPCGTERSKRGEHPMIAMAMPAREFPLRSPICAGFVDSVGRPRIPM
jgi:hypothetical protein